MKNKVYTEVITKDNIQGLGERMAICAIRGLARVMGKNELFRLYASLQRDFCYKNNEGYVLSDGYDIVQEAICFLYEHLGEKLEDKTCRGYYGDIITVKIGCYRHLGNYMQRRKRENEHNNSLESYEYNEPFTEDIRLDNSEEEQKVNDTIERMNLTDKEYETLQCYMSSMGYLEIGAYFGVHPSTIWCRRQKIQQKYNALTR